MILALDAQRFAETKKRRGPLWIDDKDAAPPGAQPIDRRFVHKQRLVQAGREDVFRAKHRRHAAPQGQRIVVGIPGGEVDKIAALVIDRDDNCRDEPEHGADFASAIEPGARTKKNVRELKRAEGTNSVHAGTMNAERKQPRPKAIVHDDRPAIEQRALELVQMAPGQAEIDRLDWLFLNKF
jgi:hypothetical protein